MCDMCYNELRKQVIIFLRKLVTNYNELRHCRISLFIKGGIFMCETAYDVCYLDDMIQKTRYLFKLIARNCQDGFGMITAYMNCAYRKYMDMGNPLYLNKTPKQILSELGVRADAKKDISEQYDEFIFEWMADIYTYMQWKYNLSSREIAEKIGPEELYAKYYPLHEASVENGVDKLRKIYQIGVTKGQTNDENSDI